ncbi:MAG: MerR family transcriptional regulator [Bacilli bacterium]
MQDELLLIGEVSRRTGLSVQAIRFYEQKGLIYPDYIAEGTGYRYFTVKTLSKFAMIASLRQFECSLSEIKEIIEIETEERMLEIFSKKIQDTNELIGKLHKTIHFIQSRKNHLEEFIQKRDQYITNEICIKETKGVWVSSHRQKEELSMEKFTLHFNKLNQEIIKKNATRDGHMFVIFHEDRTGNPGVALDVEFCIPLIWTEKHAHMLKWIPSVTVLAGSTDVLLESRYVVRDIREWMALKGIEQSGPVREVYEMDYFHLAVTKKFYIESQVPIKK